MALRSRQSTMLYRVVVDACASAVELAILSEPGWPRNRVFHAAEILVRG